MRDSCPIVADSHNRSPERCRRGIPALRIASSIGAVLPELDEWRRAARTARTGGLSVARRGVTAQPQSPCAVSPRCNGPTTVPSREKALSPPPSDRGRRSLRYRSLRIARGGPRQSRCDGVRAPCVAHLAASPGGFRFNDLERSTRDSIVRPLGSARVSRARERALADHRNLWFLSDEAQARCYSPLGLAQGFLFNLRNSRLMAAGAPSRRDSRR